MRKLIIKNLNPRVRARLRAQAREHGRSESAEAIAIIRQELAREDIAEQSRLVRKS